MSYMRTLAGSACSSLPAPPVRPSEARSDRKSLVLLTIMIRGATSPRLSTAATISPIVKGPSWTPRNSGSAKDGAASPLDSGPGEETRMGSRPEPETKMCMPSMTRWPFTLLKPFRRKVFRKRPLCDLPLASTRSTAPRRGLGVPAASTAPLARKSAVSRTMAKPAPST